MVSMIRRVRDEGQVDVARSGSSLPITHHHLVPLQHHVFHPLHPVAELELRDVHQATVAQKVDERPVGRHACPAQRHRPQVREGTLGEGDSHPWRGTLSGRRPPNSKRVPCSAAGSGAPPRAGRGAGARRTSGTAGPDDLIDLGDPGRRRVREPSAGPCCLPSPFNSTLVCGRAGRASPSPTAGTAYNPAREKAPGERARVPKRTCCGSWGSDPA